MRETTNLLNVPSTCIEVCAMCSSSTVNVTEWPAQMKLSPGCSDTPCPQLQICLPLWGKGSRVSLRILLRLCPRKDGGTHQLVPGFSRTWILENSSMHDLSHSAPSTLWKRIMGFLKTKSYRGKRNSQHRREPRSRLCVRACDMYWPMYQC